MERWRASLRKNRHTNESNEIKIDTHSFFFNSDQVTFYFESPIE